MNGIPDETGRNAGPGPAGPRLRKRAFGRPQPSAVVQNHAFNGAGSSGPPTLPANHNGGPPLDDPAAPAWGTGGIGNYFAWRRAFRKAWKPVSRATILRRLKYAEACGLTYREYTSVLLDTGRHVQPTDTLIIARIIARRPK